jgi:hypothetical protein
MSTISDALKKVQKERPGDNPRNGSPPSRIVPSRKETAADPPSAAPSGSRLTVVVVVIGLCLVCFLVIRPARIPELQSSTQSPPPVEKRRSEPSVAVPPVAAAIPSVVVDVPVVKPVIEPPPQEARPVLSGTFYAEQNPVAIINGFSLKEGETVGAYRVVKILPRSVILKSSAGEIELRLQ